MCVCMCVYACVLHRWQWEGRENWRGWWRELSEAPAALRQGGLSAGICTGNPYMPPPFSHPPSPRPPHHPVPQFGTDPRRRAVAEGWFPLTSDVLLHHKTSPFAPVDDYFDKWYGWIMYCGYIGGRTYCGEREAKSCLGRECVCGCAHLHACMDA